MIDVQIMGVNLQNMRLEAGLSRRETSAALGVSVQQLQKYETGKNRLPVDKLYMLRKIFNVSYERFFEHFGEKMTQCDLVGFARDPVAQEVYQLVSTIDSSAEKLKVREVVKVLSS